MLQVARARMGEILWREAPVDADLVIPVPDSGNAAARGLARAAGLPQDDGFIKNRYVARTFIQPGPGAAPPRPAAEVQPAARGRRGQAAGRRRRLDRARQHHPPDRADAARRRRRRGPPADLRAADQASLPLRDRHVHARGDDRPRPHASSEVAAELGADSLHYLSLEGVYEAVGGAARDALRRLLQRRVPARPGPRRPTASSRSSPSCPLVRGLSADSQPDVARRSQAAAGARRYRRPPHGRSRQHCAGSSASSDFRPGQAEAVAAALADRDALVVMPTGRASRSATSCRR